VVGCRAVGVNRLILTASWSTSRHSAGIRTRCVGLVGLPGWFTSYTYVIHVQHVPACPGVYCELSCPLSPPPPLKPPRPLRPAPPVVPMQQGPAHPVVYGVALHPPLVSTPLTGTPSPSSLSSMLPRLFTCSKSPLAPQCTATSHALWLLPP
jgi:hypothetical protein